MSTFSYPMPNSYYMSKKEIKEDNFMMCTICPSHPVFSTADSYADHIRIFHPNSITDREINMYSLYGEHKNTVGSKQFTNSVKSNEPSADSSSYISSGLEQVNERTDTIVTTDSRRKIDTASTNSERDKYKSIPDDQIGVLISEIHFMRSELTKLNEDSTSQKLNYQHVRNDIKELKSHFEQMSKTGKISENHQEENLDEMADKGKHCLNIENRCLKPFDMNVERLLIEKTKTIEQLRHEKRSLANDYDLLHRKMVAKYDSLQKDYDDLKNDQKNVEKTQADNGTVIKELNSTIAQELKQSKALQKRQEQSCKEVEKLQSLVNEKESELQKVRKQCESKGSEIFNLKTKLLKNDDRGSSMRKLNRTKEELDDRTKALAELKKKYDALCSDLITWKTKLREEELNTRNQVRKMQNKLDSKSNLIEKLEIDCKFKERKIEMLCAHMNKKDDSSYDGLVAARNDLLESSEKNFNLRKKIKDLEKKNAELELANKSKDKNLSENKTEKQNLSLSLKEMKQLNREKFRLEKRCMELEHQLADGKTKQCNLESNQESLQTRFNNLKKEFDEKAKSSVSKEEFIRLEKEKSALEKRYNDLKEQFSSTTSDTNFQSNQKAFEIVQEQYENLRGEFEKSKDSSVSKEEFIHLQKERFDLEHQFNQLKEQLLAKKNQCSDMKSYDNLQTKYTNLRKEFDEIGKSNDLKKRQIDDLKLEIRSLKNALGQKDDMISQMQKGDSKKVDLHKEKLDEYHSKIAEMNIEIEKVSNEAQTYKDKVDELKDQLIKSAERNDQHEELHADMADDLTAKTNQIQELKRLLHTKNESAIDMRDKDLKPGSAKTSTSEMMEAQGKEIEAIDDLKFTDQDEICKGDKFQIIKENKTDSVSSLRKTFEKKAQSFPDIPKNTKKTDAVASETEANKKKSAEKAIGTKDDVLSISSSEDIREVEVEQDLPPNPNPGGTNSEFFASSPELSDFDSDDNCIQPLWQDSRSKTSLPKVPSDKSNLSKDEPSRQKCTSDIDSTAKHQLNSKSCPMNQASKKLESPRKESKKKTDCLDTDLHDRKSNSSVEFSDFDDDDFDLPMDTTRNVQSMSMSNDPVSTKAGHKPVTTNFSDFDSDSEDEFKNSKNVQATKRIKKQKQVSKQNNAPKKTGTGLDNQKESNDKRGFSNLPPLSPKKSSASLVGDMQSLAPKQSISNGGRNKSLVRDQNENSSGSENSLLNLESKFSLTADLDDYDDAESADEEMSDFEEDDIALILENL